MGRADPIDLTLGIWIVFGKVIDIDNRVLRSYLKHAKNADIGILKHSFYENRSFTRSIINFDVILQFCFHLG